MPRYIVTVVDAAQSFQTTILLVPLAEGTIVFSLTGEIIKRCVRQQLPLSPESHKLTLHLGDVSGPVIDEEDILSDVILEPQTEGVYAVCSVKSVIPNEVTRASAAMRQNSGLLATPDLLGGDVLQIRLRTPATAKEAVHALPTITVQHTCTIKQLHEQAARVLGWPDIFDDPGLVNECNCNFARALTDAPSAHTNFVVIFDKSVVKRLNAISMNKNAIDQALSSEFGVGLDDRKKIHYNGVRETAGQFPKMPVVSICSKVRHMSAHARIAALADESTMAQSQVVDLHTSELPIHASAMSVSIADAGLVQLSDKGVLELYAVHRTTTTHSKHVSIGNDAIYRDRTHWQPPVPQSNRGMAMFLSSLRVTASLVKGMDEDLAAQDAVLHAFDLITSFPPALRTLCLLVQGKTPTAQECAALSHAIFHVLKGIVPTALVGTGEDRLFEGSRLLFGLLLDKAKSIKLPSATAQTFYAPYLTSLHTSQLHDPQTREPVMHAVCTQLGVVERGYFDAFARGGVLFSSPAQPFLRRTAENDSDIARLALLSGGSSSDIVAFSLPKLRAKYCYADGGSMDAIIDPAELEDLQYLAELCGQHKLAVHMPSQLESAEHPCLKFDRNVHLAVYLGEEACGMPGKSSEVFRPQHGTSSEDTAVIEQLIAPILRAHASAGTSVFDAGGGAAVRKAEAPDEILMFCADCSASMRQPTDFADVAQNDDTSTSRPAEPVIEGEFYARATFDDLKERLNKHESFDDMIAMVRATPERHQRSRATKVLALLKKQLTGHLATKIEAEAQARRRNVGHGYFYHQVAFTAYTAAVNDLKTFCAGLQTHEAGLADFLLYRASAMPREGAWTWSVGNEVPSTMRAHHIQALPVALTDIPDHLSCPVSHALMDDAVKAADGHSYSRAALVQWYAIRHSSPLHGTPTTDISMQDDDVTSNAAAQWALGEGLIDVSAYDDQLTPAKRPRVADASTLIVDFDSRVGGFQRVVPKAMSLNDLHRLAFRGLKGRHSIFQLIQQSDNTVFLPTNRSLSTMIHSDTRSVDITIRIADEEELTSGSNASNSAYPGQLALIKIYRKHETIETAYWVDRYTTATVASILWKQWRHEVETCRHVRTSKCQLWTSLNHSGDGLWSGNPCEDSSIRLSSFLNRDTCTGSLGVEAVYNDETRTHDYSGPMVLKVQVGDAYEPDTHATLSRLDVLKQMFEALINRILAFRYKTHLGLVTISTKATLELPISHVVENFRRATVDMEDDGDTALWDGLALARDQVKQYAVKHPEARKPIIVISDGADTKSINNTGHAVAFDCRTDGIVVDSVFLGDEDTLQLRTLSDILGGYAFGPESLANALAMCEMEPFLSITERPDIELPSVLSRDRAVFASQFRRRMDYVTCTEVSENWFPQRKAHPNVKDSFIPLSAASQLPNRSANGNSGARSHLRVTRLMNEMRQLVANGASATYDVYVSESDISFWKVVMSGPEDTPYAGGTFLLYIHAEDRYPAFAPKARFITRIKHVNVNLHGRICHSILDRDWTSDTSMSRLLDTFYGLLFQAELSDPINTTTTLGYHHDQVEYADEVREHVRKYAGKSREQWKQEILEGTDWDRNVDSSENVDNEAEGLSLTDVEDGKDSGDELYD